MPTRITAPEEGWNQNKQRSLAVFFDQHRDTAFTAPDGKKPFENGRPWWGYVERPADGAAMPMPVGPLSPMEWDAPWFPDEKYITASIGRVSSNGSWIRMGSGLYEQRFRIDYNQMITDYTTALRAYYTRAVNEASERNLKIPEYGGTISFQLSAIIGRPPRSPKVPEAALAGNKWLLGQLAPTFDARTQQWSVEEDEQLARLLESGNAELFTVEQAKASAERKPDEIEAIRAELDALKTMLAAAATDMADAKARMAHARAAKTSPAPV